MNFKITKIGTFCKIYRSEVLCITLNKMEELTGVSKTTLSSFENGRSTNYNHILLYGKISNKEQLPIFLNGINNFIMKGVF